MLKIISRLLVPSRCILCHTEGSGICDSCRQVALEARPSTCYLCNALTKDSQVCASCQWRTPVRRAHVLYRLDVSAESVVYGLKYDGREDVARSLAKALQAADLPYYDVITFVPDTNQRRRQRGFVAPQLLARELSRLSRKPYLELLERNDHVPQVGAGRQARWRQVKGNFRYRNDEVMRDKRVLLIDDVITTGATITECAKELKRGGSGPVYAVAVAKK